MTNLNKRIKMRKKIDNLLTSGWKFNESEVDEKNKVQMVNISILLAILGLFSGIVVNKLNNIDNILIIIESLILFLNTIIFFLLRRDRYLLNLIATFLTAQYTIFFIFLIYVSKVDSLKHTWLFTYPLILLYFQGTKKGIYWLSIMILALFIAPLQPFFKVDYSFFQITYMVFVLLTITIVIYFYQYKMNEVKNLTTKQQKLLKNFNQELELQVNYKTSELKELNESLEIKVQEKLDEVIKRDRILEVQSKQAVMGEMINMIAHQWRQPLSTVTLQISQLQFKKLLGQEFDSDNLDKVLTQISDTIIYLSDTIDDFLTYFHTDKDANEIELHELLQKAVNLALPRAKKVGVDIVIDKHEEIELVTYINEFVQVVLNIVNNAVDALSESKKEKLNIKIATQIQDNNIIINIIDNANGISDENIIHLFEPYFSTKGKNGTGLGLYMSQMIVQKQLNGSLDVRSSRNGSVFTITIPNTVE